MVSPVLNLETGNTAPWDKEKVVEIDNLLIFDNNERTRRIPCAWTDVQAMVQKMAGAIFPEEFVKSLFQPDKLTWHFIDLPGQRFLALVFAGLPPENTLGEINQAQAIVQLDRRLSGRDNSVYLSEIRSAGVMTASNDEPKAVGITHNAYNKRVTRIVVSANPIYGYSDYCFNPETQDITGLITQAMAKTAANSYYVRFNDRTNTGDELIPESSGYYFMRGRDYHEIGVDPKLKPVYTIEPTPWHLRIPNALIPAK